MRDLNETRQKDLSVIYVNYNSIENIRTSIESLKPYLSNIEYEIIISDNGDSANKVKETLAELSEENLIYLQNPQNLGFGRANNRAAQISCGKFLVFVNPDVYFNEFVSFNLLEFIQKHLSEDTVALAPKIFYPNGAPQPNGGGTASLATFIVQYFKLGYWLRRFHLVKMIKSIFSSRYFTLPKIFSKYLDNFSTLPIQYFNWVSGACFIVRNSDFRKIRGFDENFFLYDEDEDLCHRLVQLRKDSKCKVSDDLKVFHWVGGSQKGKVAKNFALPTAYKERIKSNVYFSKKYLGSANFYTLCVFYFVMQTIQIILNVLLLNFKLAQSRFLFLKEIWQGPVDLKPFSYSDKKKLLLLATRVPFPAIGGEKNKAYQTIHKLSTRFDLHLVMICEGSVHPEALAELGKWSKRLSLFQKSKWRFKWNALKSFVNGLPLQANYFYFQDVKSHIDRASLDCDLFIGLLNRSALYGEDLKIPRIIDLCDSIGLNYQNAIHKTKSFFWKSIYRYESKRLIKFEHNIVENFDKTFFLNPSEREYFESQVPQLKKNQLTQYNPIGVSEFLFSYSKKDPTYSSAVCFLGKMDYQPNILAVKWFCEKVLPLLPHEIQFYIVGISPSAQVLKLQEDLKPRVIVTGFMDDPYVILNSAICTVAPMQSGAGIQNKVLESMALGQVAITTALAAKAIEGAIHGEHLVICDTPQDLANWIIRTKGSSLREIIGPKAKQFVMQKYSWDSHLAIFEKAIGELINPTIF